MMRQTLCVTLLLCTMMQYVTSQDEKAKNLGHMLGFDDDNMVRIKNFNGVGLPDPAPITDEDDFVRQEFHRRVKRGTTGFTDQEKIDLLERHNYLRGHEGGSNIKYLKWNDRLAVAAQAWSDKCAFDHGKPAGYDISGWDFVGENLAMTQSEITVVGGIADLWYYEKVSYTYADGTCNGGCGHYTQVVWHNTDEMGCGKTFCPYLTDSTGPNFNDSYLVVCYYGPAGNRNGEKPYAVGDACTKCTDNVNWCSEGLCRNCTRDEIGGCGCSAQCEHCAYIDDDCECNCKPGWWGDWCHIQCTNHNAQCGVGYPEVYCDNAGFRPTMLALCPALCGGCASYDNSYNCTTNITTRADLISAPNGDICYGRTCNNGGTIYKSGQSCLCHCPAAFQGSKCTESVEQAANGVLLSIAAEIAQWNAVWQVLEPIIVTSVNDACNGDHFSSCCPGKTQPSQYFTVVNNSHVEIGHGFPQTNGSNLNFLVYAQPGSDNALCLNAPSASGRRKRSVSIMIPQNVVLASVASAQSNITAGLQSVGVTYGGVQTAAVTNPIALAATTAATTDGTTAVPATGTTGHHQNPANAHLYTTTAGSDLNATLNSTAHYTVTQSLTTVLITACAAYIVTK